MENSRENSRIINLINAEGYKGQEKKNFDFDPWTEIYAAIQNNLIMQDVVTAIEEHTMPVKVGDTIEEKAVPCLVLMLGGTVKGLIPVFETGLIREGLNSKQVIARMRNLIGQLTAFKVKGIHRESNLCVCSRKAALEHMAGITWKDIKVGDKRTAVVRNVNPHQAIVNVGGIETVLSVAEMSWGWVKDARELMTVGDTFDVEVIAVDKEKKQIGVSLKNLLRDSWETVPEKYSVNGEYLGTITGIAEYGIFINLNEPGVDALIPHPKSDRIRAMIKPGKSALIRIEEIKPEKRHIKANLVRVIV